MLDDLFPLEWLTGEVAVEHEGTIVFDVAPVEAEESVFGLEVADLQDAIDLGMQTGTADRERQFALDKVKYSGRWASPNPGDRPGLPARHPRGRSVARS